MKKQNIIQKLMAGNAALFAGFNPSAMAMPGKIFGMPHNEDNALMHLIGIPSAITVSGGSGAETGPRGIFEYSSQIELFSKEYPVNAWLPGIYMKRNYGSLSEYHINGRDAFEEVLKLFTQDDTKENRKEISSLTKQVEVFCNSLNTKTMMYVQNSLSKDKIVGSIGGCHGSIYGAVKAHAVKYKNFALVHFDAHHDLREAYEGQKYSHASIMRNLLRDVPEIKHLTSVGIRSYGEDEFIFAQKNKKFITTYYADDIHASSIASMLKHGFMRDIPTEEVYISFDIDFFEPYLCPSTGTPVPGGFTMQDAKMIINAIAEKKKIIGFDLNEVVPSTRVDGLVGAEILYHLCVKTMQSHGVYSF